MKKHIRFLALLLCLLMCLSVIPASAFAESVEEPAEEDFVVEAPVWEDEEEVFVEEEEIVLPAETEAVNDEAADDQWGHLLFSITMERSRYAYFDDGIVTATLSSTDPTADLTPYAGTDISMTLLNDQNERVPHFVEQSATGLSFRATFPFVDEEMAPGYYKIRAEKDVGNHIMREEFRFYYAGIVNPATCSVSASVSPTDVLPSSLMTLTAYVTDVNGFPAKGITVSFSILDQYRQQLSSPPLSGAYWRTAVTDENGIAKLYVYFPASFPEAKYTVCAKLTEARKSYAVFSFWPDGRWVQNSYGWRFQEPNGYFVRNDWAQIKGYWYHFDANSYMQTGWVKLGNYWFYLGTNGAMRTGWLKYEGYWYYLTDTGAMQTGWFKYNGSWYHLRADGVMQTGWIKDGGSWYYLYTNGQMMTGWITYNGARYYLYTNGQMMTGWLKYNGSWYYLYSNGQMMTGWLKYNNNWYYLDTDGVMLANTSREINGKVYNFDANGVCLNP